MRFVPAKQPPGLKRVPGALAAPGVRPGRAEPSRGALQSPRRVFASHQVKNQLQAGNDELIGRGDRWPKETMRSRSRGALTPTGSYSNGAGPTPPPVTAHVYVPVGYSRTQPPPTSSPATSSAGRAPRPGTARKPPWHCRVRAGAGLKYIFQTF